MIKLPAASLVRRYLPFLYGVAVIFSVGALLGLNPVISLFLYTVFLYFSFARTQPSVSKVHLLYLSLLWMIILAAAYFIVRIKSAFYIPVCTIPLLCALLFEDLFVAFLLTLAVSVPVASFAETHSLVSSFFLSVLFICAGIVAMLSVRGARRRVEIIRAGVAVGACQALALLFIRGFTPAAYGDYAVLSLNGLVCSLLALATLPIFEIIFKTATNVSLLELADFNHPLLQRLMKEAPGTYHHSLIVGNMADAAAGAIGANALLARTGAYYHDIGKLAKPDYFSENMYIHEGRHDTLAPTMSKLVIMNHVKEGVELAHKYGLNPRLIDFIQQHHGNSLVYYFYRRALEGLEEDDDIKEEGFRYPGPRPRTKEVAIVLLADSVEAAGRALKDPPPGKIEEVAHKIINNKFIDRQLDECDLTLKDLEVIAAVFAHLLNGIYHSRVTYPQEQA